MMRRLTTCTLAVFRSIVVRTPNLAVAVMLSIITKAVPEGGATLHSAN